MCIGGKKKSRKEKLKRIENKRFVFPRSDLMLVDDAMDEDGATRLQEVAGLAEFVDISALRFKPDRHIGCLYGIYHLTTRGH